eukprot:CAMPEP_0206249494 /NCGR_PEP_ID=MMETSP0047_2-20121206/20938_1 /ASSEMBLY_ACC=CAM_ASM_000192 /TAXON_ID=195065 /ORGANISM="Chroomonas mesostigmatica_cf, Strain CCMP1168" /LENGTH=133 /DNA_ID=CAMNT_0053675219 /DNA_START=163 /DNA_END=565 /DNA_ORIENTATION=+
MVLPVGSAGLRIDLALPSRHRVGGLALALLDSWPLPLRDALIMVDIVYLLRAGVHPGLPAYGEHRMQQQLLYVLLAPRAWQAARGGSLSPGEGCIIPCLPSASAGGGSPCTLSAAGTSIPASLPSTSATWAPG